MVLATVSWQPIAQAVNVILLAAVLYKLLYRPADKYISERQKQVREALEEAEARRKEAEAQLAEYQARIKDAEKEAQSILDRARQAGQEASRRILAEAEQEAQQILERAQADAKVERERALAAIRSQIVEAAMEAAEHMVKQNLTQQDQLRIARKFIAKVGEKQ